MNKRKAFFDLSENIVPNKLVRNLNAYSSFRNVFQVENKNPFATLPIIRKDENEDKEESLRSRMTIFQHCVHYFPSNSIAYERYKMGNKLVFEIFNGREELLISRENRSKIRVVFVDEKKRIEQHYDRNGKEKQLLCYDEKGSLLFERSIVTPHQYDAYISRLYEDSQVIRIWNE